MKSLMLLLRRVLEDLGARCDVSTDRDLKTIAGRVECEGISFLTISLPNFVKDFERCLEQGFVGSDQFDGFSRSGGLPKLFRGFLCLIFDSRTGQLLNDPDHDAVYSIRQASMLFGKLEGTCTPSRELAAIDLYIECDKEVALADAERTPESLSRFKSASARLLGRPIATVEKHLSRWDVLPKHGPGATADYISGNAKYDQRTWPSRLDEYFPAVDFAIPNYRYRYLLDEFTYLEPEDEIPARLVSVPKTMKTPRLIAIEPTAVQYAQQSLNELLVEALEGRDNPLPYLIGFEDQSLNRQLAKYASATGAYATLDLSEASDRVSNQLVLAMTSWAPFLSGSLQACRTRKVDVPGHGSYPIAKFSSMGSAVCFPVEAMVFATIVLIAIEEQLNCRLTPGALMNVMSHVRIYGDDIIVPVEYASTVARTLEAFGLRVNRNKSFWTGKFRESCGGDYFDGTDVTPVRVRKEIPTQRQQVSGVISTVSLRNQLYKAGLWRATRYLDDILSGLIPFPYVEETSAVLGRVSYLGYETQRMHPTLHKPLVKGVMVRSKLPKSNISGEGALLKWFLKRGNEPLDMDHLTRAGRSVAVYFKHGWAAPY